jgi:hypothetical protein
MAYGSVLTDVVQSSVTGTPPQFNDGTGAQIGMLARAWVNFNPSSGSVVVNASFNVSSVTYGGTGYFVVNFTTAMPDAKYSVNGSPSPDASTYSTSFMSNASNGSYSAQTTTTCPIQVCRVNPSTAGLTNPYVVSVSFFR